MTDSPTTPTPAGTELSRERADLLESLGAARYFLRHTVGGLTDEQASQRTTISELTLGGLIKHVASTEKGWADFVVNGPAAIAGDGDYSDYANGFRLLEGETLAGVLESYAAVSAATDELVRTVDLDHDWPLPPAPWFTPGATRSARRVFAHIVAETAQHAGHADIIRESLDGQKTMG
jgi:hypothetical protein